MTSRLKRAFKLIKYGFQLKMNLISALILMIIAIPLLGIGLHGYAMGSFYLILAPMILLQLLFTLLYSGIAKSSPLAHTIEIELIDVLSVIIGIIGYTLLIAYINIRNQLSPATYSLIHPLMTAIVISMLLIYFTLCYKFFILSIIVLILCILPVFCILGSEYIISIFTDMLQGISMPTSCLLGYLILVIGLILSGLLRRVLYKYPLSKLAGGAKLRKQL